MHQHSNYCVVIDGDKFTNGAKIQLWQCDDRNRNQVWDFQYSGQIRTPNSPTPMCLVIDGNEAFNGAKIQVWSCSNSASSATAQHWLKVSFDPRGKAMYAVPNGDKACPRPFLPVSQSAEACATAAETLRPGSGCQWPGSPLRSWAQRPSDLRTIISQRVLFLWSVPGWLWPHI